MTWRLLFISTGETSLSALRSFGGKRVKAGQDVRFLDIPANAGSGLGIFDRLPSPITKPSDFADSLRTSALEQCGTAGPEFMRSLLADNKLREHVRFIIEKVEEFVGKVVPKGATGQVMRAARRFALIAAAGTLAVRFGILPWPESEAECRARTCFSDWLAARGGAGLLEAQQALSRIEAIVSRHGSSRFQRLSEQGLSGRGLEPAGSNWAITDGWGYACSENTAVRFRFVAIGG
jgi:uncharacterized protein (DUF927 family)